MKFNKNLKVLTIFLILFGRINLTAQDQRPVVEIGENKVNLNQPFVLTIIVKNEENRPNCKFPDINGFKKRAISYAIIPITLNGKASFDQRVSQEYFPLKSGQFNFSGIAVQVNEMTIVSPNFTVTVTDSEKDETEENFKDFIDGSAYEFVDVKDDAFFGITTNKLKPYVGEGFLITVAFYISQSNKAEMDFVNVNGQLDGILKKIRPKNCWEENLGITEIKGNKLINIANKKYFQYKIYQAIYYPFNNQLITIPAVKWQMLKYKIAKDQEASNSKLEDFKVYTSKSIFIKPKQIPKSSSFSTDYVGDFELEEFIDREKVQTGKSFNYTFKVKGVGNLAILKFPEMLSDSLFEIYEPKVNQQYSNILGKLMAEKSFNFNIVPKFAGAYSLRDHFFINYFNVRTNKYETLRAEKQIEVVGNDISVNDAPVSSENDLFQNLEALKSDEISFDFRSIILQAANFLIITMLVSMIYIIWPTKNKS